MLYKKVHRQHLRQFRIGRKFTARYFKRICRLKVIGKPEMGKHCITIICSDLGYNNGTGWVFIPRTGCFYFKEITWLN